jgi:hypothetical protein
VSRKSRYVDLHHHPHGRAFNYLRNSKHYKKDIYNPWTVIISKFKSQKKGNRAFAYSQCDFVQAWNGSGGVLFAALYPFEKGFFKGGGKVDKRFVDKLINFIDIIPVFGNIAVMMLRSFLKPISGSDGELTSLKDHFQSLLMRLSKTRINYLQSNQYDYYEELIEEYDFLKATSNIEMTATIHGNVLRRLSRQIFSNTSNKESLKATGKYIIAKNYIETISALEENNLVVILTIEGMHSLSTDTSMDQIFNRIKEIKGWEYPVLFITFAHHFNNFLCGHAHSLINKATTLASQESGMQVKFNEIGLAAARFLLSLDNNNIYRTNLGRRILIDVKHMAAESRRQFYNEIILDCLCNKNDKIPVIASHVGYSGVLTLGEFCHHGYLKKETDNLNPTTGLNHWNINLCLEDVEVIIKTNGLFGLCLDQRILGSSKKNKMNSKELLKNNLERLLIDLNHSENLSHFEKSNIWTVLCLGTDYEGYVDPLDDFPTILEFDKLEETINSIIEDFINEGKKETYFLNDPSTIAYKICKDNVMTFLKVNF